MNVIVNIKNALQKRGNVGKIINSHLVRENLKVVLPNVKVEGRQKDDEVDNDPPWYPEDPGPDEEDIVRE